MPPNHNLINQNRPHIKLKFKQYTSNFILVFLPLVWVSCSTATSEQISELIEPPIKTNTQVSEPTPTPETPDILFRYVSAVQMLRASLYEDAIPQFDMVIRVLPNFAEAHHKRGICHYNENQENLALEDFNKAIELKEDFAEAYRDRGVFYRNIGEHQKGINDLHKALQIYSNREDSEKIKELDNLLRSWN